MKRITVVGHANSFSGYGQLFCRTVIGMAKLGWYPNVRATAVVEQFNSKIPEEVRSRLVHRVQPEPWELIIHPPEMKPTPTKRTCFFTMWESSKLKRSALDSLRECEAIVVPNRWNAKNFKVQGLTAPIHIIPLGVDPSIFRYSQTPNKCIFGAGGRMAHGGIRKGVNEVIDAFQAAFPTEQDVKLHVKVFTDCPVKKVDDHRITLFDQFMTERALGQWMRNITCFVSASRSEGWGLLQHQAMACGRPIIACKHSGVAEFLTEQNGYCVDFTEEAAGGMYAPTISCEMGYWARPNMDSMVSQMRRVYENRDEAAAKGKLAAKDVEHLTWDNTVEKLANLLTEIGV